jgi:cytochrome c oxidase assembly factor CtaG
MIWVIVIESIIILFMGWMIWDSQKAIKTLIDMWAEEKNRQWLEMMKESGAEIIKVD